MISEKALLDLNDIVKAYNISYDFTISTDVKNAIRLFKNSQSIDNAKILCQAILADSPFSNLGFVNSIKSSSTILKILVLLNEETNISGLDRENFIKIVQHTDLDCLLYNLKSSLLLDRYHRFKQDNSNTYFNLVLNAPFSKISSFIISNLLKLNTPDDSQELFNIFWSSFVIKSRGRYILTNEGKCFSRPLSEYKFKDLDEDQRVNYFLGLMYDKLFTPMSDTEKLKNVEMAYAISTLRVRRRIAKTSSDETPIQTVIRRAVQGDDLCSQHIFSPLKVAFAIDDFLSRSEAAIGLLFSSYYLSKAHNSSLFGHQFKEEVVSYNSSTRSTHHISTSSPLFSMDTNYEGYLLLVISAISANGSNPEEFASVLNCLHQKGLLDSVQMLLKFENLLFCKPQQIVPFLKEALNCKDSYALISKLPHLERQHFNDLLDELLVVNTTAIIEMS
ncbi:MAG: hypothetical protein P1U74_11380 [Legionellaceae bacterium]|nr:hypothetical protein [Legionellaceae bacterium]